MDEYISKESAISIFEAKAEMAVCTPAQSYFHKAAKMIELLPAADVAPEQMRAWIRAKDRLPTDEDEMVLAVVFGKPCENITLDGAYELATYIEREGWIIHAYPEWETPQVTHWMPLPEPPKEGE